MDCISRHHKYSPSRIGVVGNHEFNRLIVWNVSTMDYLYIPATCRQNYDSLFAVGQFGMLGLNSLTRVIDTEVDWSVKDYRISQKSAQLL